MLPVQQTDSSSSDSVPSTPLTVPGRVEPPPRTLRQVTQEQVTQVVFNQHAALMLALMNENYALRRSNATCTEEIARLKDRLAIAKAVAEANDTERRAFVAMLQRQLPR